MLHQQIWYEQPLKKIEMYETRLTNTYFVEMSTAKCKKDFIQCYQNVPFTVNNKLSMIVII